MQCCRAVNSDLQDTLHCLPLFCRSPVSVEIVGLLSSLDNNHIESSFQLPIQPQIICVCINPCCVLLTKKHLLLPLLPMSLSTKYRQLQCMVSPRNLWIVHWSGSRALLLCGFLYPIHAYHMHFRHHKIPPISFHFY